MAAWRWSIGPVVGYRVRVSGTVGQGVRYSGTVGPVQWDSGSGTVVQWDRVQWDSGAVGQGAVVQWDRVQWCRVDQYPVPSTRHHHPVPSTPLPGTRTPYPHHTARHAHRSTGRRHHRLTVLPN